MSATQSNALTGRRFLIVTAPFGPFGTVLNDTLKAAGAEVDRVLMNAGDELYWRRREGVRFKGRASEWEGRFLSMVGDYTDVLIFGEGGPYNQAAIRHAPDYAARLWVLENGYFRPDWITVERNGVNASSSLPRDRSGYDDPAPELPTVRPVGRILPYHVTNISLHHLIQLPGRWMYPNYVAPYTQPPWLQCAGHIRRYFQLAFQSRSRTDADRIARRGPFFIVCLQREGDAQLLRYSTYADNAAFLSEIFGSFVEHAPADARLIVKNHPLDPGLVDLASITRGLSLEYDLADRVNFIDGGNLAQLCRLSRGMIVNNSTAALSALGFRTPVKALGRAFFDFEGLTDQKPLNDFWRSPEGPEPDLFTRFRAHVLERTQINGNYHGPNAMRETAAALADRFAREP
jgi:capsular polysaccharide export protein